MSIYLSALTDVRVCPRLVAVFVAAVSYYSLVPIRISEIGSYKDSRSSFAIAPVTFSRLTPLNTTWPQFVDPNFARENYCTLSPNRSSEYVYLKLENAQLANPEACTSIPDTIQIMRHLIISGRL